MAAFEELVQLIERDIPQGRQHLQDSHNNLESVASYCEENYLRAGDKRHALEETKNYTTQSLASVAYQINMLATNFLHLLDLQVNQLSDMESSVNHLSQTVMIHKEKVARREIGVLTTNKTTARPPGVKNPGIVFPDTPERPVKYVRKSIDYTALDEVGHGVKPVQQQNPKPRRPSSSSSGTIPGSAGMAPTTRPPTPPSNYGHIGTLTRQSSSPYRTPAPPVSPPSVPVQFPQGYGMRQLAPQMPQQQQMQQQPMQVPPMRKSDYAAVQNIPIQNNPDIPPQGLPMGMVQPMSHMPGRPLSHTSMMGAQEPPPTPPPPPMPEEPRVPPSTPSYRGHVRFGNGSPPLPPPPDLHTGGDYEDHFAALPPPSFDNPRPRNSIPSSRVTRQQEFDTGWVPENYIEKVVAIYDYVKDKEDELSFAEGSLIYVMRKNDDGWWEGTMDGITGLFPGNYVEPCI